jgi:hypothetical protein
MVKELREPQNKEESLEIILTLINRFKINTVEIQLFKDLNSEQSSINKG